MLLAKSDEVDDNKDWGVNLLVVELLHVELLLCVEIMLRVVLLSFIELLLCVELLVAEWLVVG